MATTKRIAEIWQYFVFHEPSNEEDSINRYTILRKRFEKILQANKKRSILLAMGSDTSPIFPVIYNMNDEMFEEFIADDTITKRRKEIYKRYG